ncbi:MAG: prenyltransferase [Chloroflexota bacterium]
MQNKTQHALIELIKVSQPLALLVGAVLYASGVGLLVYLGKTVDWPIYWSGQGIVTLLQLSSAYLKTYYDRLLEPERRVKERSSADDDLKPAQRTIFLLAAITTLTVGAMITFFLISRSVLQPASLLILGLAWLCSFFYGVPPLRLAYSGYGELISAVVLTTLVPGFGFLLQSDELIPSMGLFSFPLLALLIALALAVSLENYYANLKAGRQNLMTRLGWQRGMALHNMLVLLAFLLIGVSPLIGLPWNLTWPRLLVMPVGLFQVWMMWQIGNGAKPNWRLLRLIAAATFALVLYLHVFTLWTG